MIKTPERNAETKKEYLAAWNRQVDKLAGFRPIPEDQERFGELQTELKQMIARTANSAK